MEFTLAPYQPEALSAKKAVEGVEFSVETAKIVGTPTDGFWSQVHTFFPQDKEKKEKRGDLLAVLVLSGVEEGIGAVAFGREILGRLHEEYYGNLEGSAFERLTFAVRKIGLEYEGLEIVAASLFGPALYLAICGEGKALLKREGQLGIVLQGTRGDIQTASGLLKEEDLILLASERFFQVVGFGVLRAALENNSLDDAVESLAPVILGHEKMADVAAILALVKQKPAVSFFPAAKQEEEPSLKTEKPRFLKHFFSHLRLPERKSFFVRRKDRQERKNIFWGVAVCFLAIFCVSLIFGLRQRSAAEKQQKVQNLFHQAEDKFNQGKMLALTNPAEGKATLNEAQNLINQGLALKKDSQDLLLLKEQLEKFSASLATETVLSSVPVFMDLSLIEDGAMGVSLSLSGKNLLVLDKDKRKIYQIDIEQKSAVSYALNEGGDLITAFDDKIMIFGEKGITEVNTKSKNVTLKIAKDEGWKEIVGFSSFNGNLYLLDKGASDIWRYLASGESYSSRKSWFVGNPPDLSSAVSLGIDGSIWVLEKDKISKFTLGKPDSFALSKMQENFLNPAKIYTSADDQNLYVLDKGREKVFVIAKNGEFKASYAWQGIEQVTDLIAVESAKKIFLLSKAKIYEIQIK